MNKNVTLKIPGLHCYGCISSITQVLESLGGILDIVGNLDRKELTIDYDHATITPFAIAKQLDAIGYPVESTSNND